MPSSTKTAKHIRREAASFRDPSGFLFSRDGILYRQVNKEYKEDYDRLMKSGLYETLADAGVLIPHKEVDLALAQTDEAYKVIKPEAVPFISYPYEWCFSQLKDAALATLKIQKLALDFGMSLKDASAYNIQFMKGKPVLIDTLSFERYLEGKAWAAYRQFCQHFLAPLALMAHKDVRLSQLLRVYIDGIPLDLASALLPARTKLGGLLLHLHLHAKSQSYFAGKPDKAVTGRQRRLNRAGFIAVINSLESAVKSLEWAPRGTEWGEYYTFTNYSDVSFNQKKKLVEKYLSAAKPKLVWDLGANNGLFSRIAADKGVMTISSDIDPAAVELSYRQVTDRGEANILPLVIDLTNPSPAIGWANKERVSFLERGPADAVLALALIHHLAISNNLPLKMIAETFSQLGRFLIIEFVPKSDQQVQKLLASREDIFTHYTQDDFEKEFGRFFKIVKSTKIKGSERTLYLMEKV